MTHRLLMAAAIGALTLLNYFQFPGHTYLQADTQIYIPILEHLWDPGVLAQDLLVQKPHVSFTLYDEVAAALRKLTGLPFRHVLAGEQIFFRGLGIWGLYLIASAAGLSVGASLLVAAMVSLGATISGPSVLSFEYEPTPRGFALPLVLLATGLVARGSYLRRRCRRFSGFSAACSHHLSVLGRILRSGFSSGEDAAELSLRLGRVTCGRLSCCGSHPGRSPAAPRSKRF